MSTSLLQSTSVSQQRLTTPIGGETGCKPVFLDEDLVAGAILDRQARGEIGWLIIPFESLHIRSTGTLTTLSWSRCWSYQFPPTLLPEKQIAATTLVNEVADGSSDGHSHSQSEESVGLSPTTFGTAVHRINELRPPMDEWPAMIPG